MRPWPPFVIALACLGLSACSSTHFKPWQGGGIQVGKGGACEQIEGIDVRSYGLPNRAFRTIGIIEDVRGSGAIPMARRAKCVAREAKQHGGDAVVVVNEGREYVGTFSSLNTTSTTNLNSSWTGMQSGGLMQLQGMGTARTTGFGSGLAVPIFRAHGLYQVVQYADGGGMSARPASAAPTARGVKTDRHGTSYLE